MAWARLLAVRLLADLTSLSKNCRRPTRGVLRLRYLTGARCRSMLRWEWPTAMRRLRASTGCANHRPAPRTGGIDQRYDAHRTSW